MAKLSARGRKAVVEVAREYSAEQLQAAHDRAFPAGTPLSGLSLTTWERTTRRLMSDGSVLEKRDVRFQPDWLDKAGRRHSYGWKVHGKLKADLTAADFVRAYEKPRRDGSPSSWTVTQGAAIAGPTKVISLARVKAAVSRDDSTGFCLSCGSEQGGTEPDADSYRCESCGSMSVQGAENVLMGMA
jgi:hypothetical protein